MSAWNFLLNALTIVLIDLLLAGDNALVIAMAVRSLPKPQRRAATVGGAAAAVALRVSLTAIAAKALGIPFLQLGGGLLILWIGLKVLLDAGGAPDAAPAAKRLLQAIWYIVVADCTMSLDNVLAIAGASKGNLYLIIFGLGLSIPLVVFAANLLATLMDRYPALIYLGSAMLGKVGAEMVLTDAWVARTLKPSAWTGYAVEAAAAAGVVIAGKLIGAARARRALPG